MRVEKDSLGELEVPLDAYYGVQSYRSKQNFDVADERLPLDLVYGMVKLKWACARANLALDLLDARKCEAIQRACRRVLDREFDDQFIVDVFQAGSGTSSNMNVNEVLANVACVELGGRPGDRHLVHPNDDVNKGQSTNNIFPSGIRVATVDTSKGLMASLQDLIDVLIGKGEEWKAFIKSGRTHLQDAVPISLGQEFSAYAHALAKDLGRLNRAKKNLFELGVGGNAVGTGVNTKPAFRSSIVEALNEITQESYRVAEHGIEITQFLTDLAEYSSAQRLLATDLLKICNDLRLMASGPNTGLHEISLPAVEPGSSIMPGKINPSICEAANMACMQVLGYDHAVSIAAGAGQLELNTHMPLIGHNITRSNRILSRCCSMLSEKCVVGIVANRDLCYSYFERSGGLGTVLNPKLGYDAVAELVKESLREAKTMKTLVVEKGIMSEQEFEALVQKSTQPNLE